MVVGRQINTDEEDELDYRYKLFGLADILVYRTQ